MTEAESATRHLGVIRSLMERATLYRALSAPTALVGGLLSLGGLATAYYAEDGRHSPLLPAGFLAVWLAILVLTCLINTMFLWQKSRRQEEPFFSAGMKCAFSSLAPAFCSAGVLTILLRASPMHLALAWITLYGLGLLATQQFAPRSLVLLGLAFLVTGGALLATWKHLFAPNPHAEPSAVVVSGILAATFGGYHLAYAAAVWALGEERAPGQVATTPHV